MLFWCDSLDLFRNVSPSVASSIFISAQLPKILLPLPPFLSSNISSYSPCHSLLFTPSISPVFLLFFRQSLPEESKKPYISLLHTLLILGPLFSLPNSPTSFLPCLQHQVNSPLPDIHSYVSLLIDYLFFPASLSHSHPLPLCLLPWVT